MRKRERFVTPDRARTIASQFVTACETRGIDSLVNPVGGGLTTVDTLLAHERAHGKAIGALEVLADSSAMLNALIKMGVLREDRAWESSRYCTVTQYRGEPT